MRRRGADEDRAVPRPADADLHHFVPILCFTLIATLPLLLDRPPTISSGAQRFGRPTTFTTACLPLPCRPLPMVVVTTA